MKIAITAQAYLRNTLKKVGKKRTEIIDTKTNEIFESCKNIKDVKNAFSSFWNHMNPYSREVVKVIKIKKLA